MRRVLPLSPLLGVGIAIAVMCSGCMGDACNRNSDDPPVPFHGGLTSSSNQDYITSLPEEPYLDFPSGRRYRLFHDLAGVPTLIVPYVSFSPTPVLDDSGFTISPGNQTVIHRITDEYIDVENDTCTHFYLRVVASVDDFTTPSGVDAGVSQDGGN